MSRIAQLLQSALDATSNGVLITDNTSEDNPIIYANPGFEQMTGYDLSEILGNNCRFLQGEKTNRDDVTRLRDAIRQGEAIEVELLNYKKDGTPFWNDLSVSPVKNEQGQITHFIGVQSDITDRREKENARRAQLMAENVVDTVREPLIILNEDLTVYSVNQSFYRFFQTRPEDTIGRRIYDIENGYLNIPALKTLIERILPEKNPFEDFEITHEFPRIGEKTLLLNARRLDSQEGRPEYILLAIEDITRWRQDKAALFESERRSNLIEGLRDVAIITTDPAGRIQSWNSGARDIIGYSDEEIIGQNLSVLFLPEDVESGVPGNEMQRAMNGSNASSDRWLRRKDGTTFWAVGFLSALYDESGVFQGFAKLIHEQTERKRLEEEIVRRTDDLAARDRAKDEFLAMLGHELRNPLSAVSSAAQAAKLLGNKEVERPLAIVERQVKHMSQLVNDLLDVARVTQGKITLQLTLLAFDSIVISAARNGQQVAIKKGLDFQIDVASNVFVQGDSVRLEQIVNNLITNAIKYTPSGEVRVQLEKLDGSAVLTISDTGIGMDTELMPRLFQLFSQANRSLARSEGGLGVGLTIVKQLVELHGGTVEGHSEGEGYGSTFRVTLPLDQNQGSDDSENDEDGGVVGNGRRKILVVDDSEDAAEMVALTLELWGYLVLVAHDGEKALEIALRERPPVVLLDIGLPNLDGYQVAQKIREKYSSDDIKLVALTGYAQESDVQKALSNGFDAHLAKPISFATLKEHLSEYEKGK
ncbi:PAS domain-containing protein [bacterium]|nr:MAG: PAS domain-containing protein [bacterium]